MTTAWIGRAVLGSLVAVGLWMPTTASSQSESSSAADAVRQASFDYIDGFYTGDDALLHRSVHPEVVKFGFAWNEADERYVGEPMSFAAMLEYAAGVRQRGGAPPAGAPREVEILDVQDQTAATKVTAWWGTDYLQLARVDGRWMIMHVLWQTPARSGGN